MRRGKTRTLVGMETNEMRNERGDVTGFSISSARLRLDADTRLDVGLQIHHLTSIQPGPPGTRLGCSWLGLSAQGMRSLQRYIDQTQKRQRLIAARADAGGQG